MAENVAGNLAPENPCCIAWKKKYSKLEEKRNALRQAVNLLNQQIDKVQAENLNVKKGFEEEKAQREKEKEQKEKLLVSLNNEIRGLKDENSLLLQKKEDTDFEEKDKAIKHLKVCVSEKEEEIKRLKELFDKEKKRADAEKKKANEEKKKANEEKRKAAEELKNVKLEKGRIESENKLLTIEGKKVGEYKLQMEDLKKEVNETKLKLTSEAVKCGEAQKKSKEDKLNAVQAKKQVELAKSEADKQRKLSEANIKKFIEEESRANNLFEQLKETTRRVEELQKEKDQLLASKHLGESLSERPDKYADANVQNEKVNQLNEQLKFEKSRVKHAKNVAKLEKERTTILQQQLCCLKLEFRQFAERITVLDKHFSPAMEGIDGTQKAGDLNDMEFLNLKEKRTWLEPNKAFSVSENHILKRSSVTTAHQQNLQETDLFIPVYGRDCIRSMSGIDSKLESLLGGSNQKMLQTSAINSSMTSFSDGQLVGSQERGSISVSTPLKLGEENKSVQPTACIVSSEHTRMRSNDAMVAENSVKSSDINNFVGRGNGDSKKRERLLDIFESIELLYSEGKKLHRQTEEKLPAVTHRLLSSQTAELLEGVKDVEKELQGGSYSKHDRLSKKRKSAHDHVKQLRDNEKQKKKRKGNTSVTEDANQVKPPVNPVDKALSCRENVTDSDRSNRQDMTSFAEVVDYMKLLDLDNAADEERYRMALERPLSPTLPEIESHGGMTTLDLGDLNPVNVEPCFEAVSKTKENVMPNMEPNPISLEHDVPATPCLPLLPDHVYTKKKSADGSSSAGHLSEQGNSQTFESGLEVEMSKVPIQSEQPGYAPRNIPRQFVIYSGMKDSSSIQRIFCATITCMVNCSFATQTDCVIFLLALKKEEMLSAKEKACVFFSLLLLSFSIAAVDKSGKFWHSDLIPCLDSLAGQMRQVMQNAESRNLLENICCIDEVLHLIKDFLFQRTMVVYTDFPNESLLLEGDSKFDVLVDGVNYTLSFGGATAHQLVAGSVVLASICAAIDHIGFICEVSYSLLRLLRPDRSVVLAILHIFAYLGGEKMFTLKGYSLTVTVLKFLVTFIERESQATAKASCSDLFPCSKCPFSKNVASLEEVILLLLQKIGSYAPAVKMQQELVGSVGLLSSVLLSDKNNAMQSLIFEEDKCVIGMKRNSPGCLIKSDKPDILSRAVCQNFCHIFDVLSLVELLACNMGWELAYEKVILLLLKLMEAPHIEPVTISIVILLGQLGRLGVDAVGYDDKRVENLRDKLSTLLRRDTTIVAGLPIQIAIVNALLGLIPLNFEIVAQNIATDSSFRYKYETANLIRKWFSLLSKEQQAFSTDLLQAADSSEIIIDTTSKETTYCYKLDEIDLAKLCH